MLFFLQFVSVLEFRLWRQNMKLLERETKELGRSTSHDIHNTRSYTVALKYVPDIITDGRSLFSERVHTHTQERERERERDTPTGDRL